MKAIRWILFCLLAFGLGTGVAFAVHPPTVGIPTATADGLSADLAKIKEYAADGKCNAVRGRLQGAAAKVDKLPARTSASTIEALNTSLSTVRDEALSACQEVASAKLDDARRAQEALEATTPETTPQTTPTQEVAPTTAPETEAGGPDPGPGTGEPTTPDQPGVGGGEDDGDDGDTSGGVTIPSEEAVRQRLDKERKKWEKQADKVRKAWGQ